MDAGEEHRQEQLDGKIWLPDIGHATHYHAYWVRPSWVHEMSKLYKLGVHTFYRPRAWGNDGRLGAGAVKDETEPTSRKGGASAAAGCGDAGRAGGQGRATARR